MLDDGRYLGLDVGEVRTGVAISDPLGMIATAHSVIQVSTPEKDSAAIKELVEENEIVMVVAGLPLDQNGEIGPQAQKILNFIDVLRGVLEVEIVTIDERFTSAAAERMLIQADVRRKNRKKVIDKVAAQHILQQYLDWEANRRKREA